jgi:xanthine/uracil permease
MAAPDPAALPPTTTAQQDLTTAGQRHVNLIWERTQAAIAIFVVMATLGISGYQVVTGRMDQIPTIFSTGFGMVVGFYFGRTNHSAVGGIGPKKPGEWR